MNIGYRKTEKIDIGTPLVTDSSIGSRSLVNILISKIIFESLNIHQMNIHLNPSVRMYMCLCMCVDKHVQFIMYMYSTAQR